MDKKPLTIQEFARMGGKATLKNYGKDHFKRISALGVAARKNKQTSETPQN